MLHPTANEHCFILNHLSDCLSKNQSIWVEGYRNDRVYRSIKEEIRELDIPSCLNMIEVEQGPQDYTETLLNLAMILAQQDLKLAIETLSSLVLDYFFKGSTNHNELSFLTSKGMLCISKPIESTASGIRFYQNGQLARIESLYLNKHSQIKILGLGELCLVKSKTLAVQEICISRQKILARYMRATLLGILSGILQGMVHEAIAYSKVRQSAGKAIFHHQAVSLRIGNIIIDFESLNALIFQSLRILDRHPKMESFLASLSQYAHNISKEAVQVAGGHGYVDGLQLKRLYEESKGIISFLNLLFEDSQA